MRKSICISFFILLNFFGTAQSDVYQKLKKAIQENHPEISLQNKLLAVNLWSADNLESREANKQFNSVYRTYEFAKLKGGNKGLVCVAINKDGETASIILNNDGVTKLLQLNLQDISKNISANIVFDENGAKVYENISSDKVFESINKLITR